MTRKFDMEKFKPLPEFSGRALRAEVVVHGRIALVKARGKWHTLNWRSGDPANLRNRMERSNFADAIGASAKDVENYARRAKAARRREEQREEVEHAKIVLAGYGYIVTEPEKL